MNSTPLQDLQHLPQHLQQLPPQYSHFYDPALSDYFDQQEDSASLAAAALTKRERLERLFDGHAIKTPLDGFLFFLRFSLFILLINKLILITTFLIQGKLFDHVDWDAMGSPLVSTFIALYFLATMFYIVMLPVPDNRCGCHFFLVLSLVALSTGEIVLNQSNRYLRLTVGLKLICWSISSFAALHLFCLAVKLAVSCARSLYEARAPSRIAHQVV